MNTENNNKLPAGEHVSFDDIAELMLSDRLTPEIMELSGKVFRHISKCSECNELYMSMLKVRESLESLDYSALRAAEPSLSERLVSGAKKVIKRISFRISEMSEILGFDSAGFAHPELSLAMKSASAEPENEPGKSVINSSIAGEGIRIGAEPDGTVTVYADPASYPVGSRAVLLNGDETFTAVFEHYNDTTNFAVFDDVGEGDCTLELEGKAGE